MHAGATPGRKRASDRPPRGQGDTGSTGAWVEKGALWAPGLVGKDQGGPRPQAGRSSPREGRPRLLSYPIVLEPDGDTLVATCPHLPGMITFGADEAGGAASGCTMSDPRVDRPGAPPFRADLPRPFPRPSPRRDLTLHATLVVETRLGALRPRLDPGRPAAAPSDCTCWRPARSLTCATRAKSGWIEAAFRALGVEPHVDIRKAA